MHVHEVNVGGVGQISLSEPTPPPCPLGLPAKVLFSSSRDGSLFNAAVLWINLNCVSSFRCPEAKWQTSTALSPPSTACLPFQLPKKVDEMPTRRPSNGSAAMKHGVTLCPIPLFIINVTQLDRWAKTTSDPHSASPAGRDPIRRVGGVRAGGPGPGGVPFAMG